MLLHIFKLVNHSDVLEVFLTKSLSFCKKCDFRVGIEDIIIKEVMRELAPVLFVVDLVEEEPKLEEVLDFIVVFRAADPCRDLNIVVL